MPPVARDRFNREPIISPATGKPIEIEIQDEDVPLLLSLMHRYHYLSPEYAAPLIGRSYATTARRMRLLRRNGGYLSLCPEQESDYRRYYTGNLFYKINNPGLEYLQDKGYEPISRPAPANLKHQVMIDQAMASLEIGVNAKPGFEIIWWEELLRSERTPQSTREAPAPLTIPLGRYDGRDRILRADGLPFVLKRTIDDKTDFMFFIGFEADCGNASNRSDAQSAIKTKFENYIRLIESKIHTSHFGAKTFFVMFMTPSKTRRANWRQLLCEMTVAKPWLRKPFLFTGHPILTSEEKPRPTGHMLFEEYERAGLPNISLIK